MILVSTLFEAVLFYHKNSNVPGLSKEQRVPLDYLCI